MQYIIDGHNLIGQIRSLSLRDAEDEEALIDMLVPFLRAKKSRAMIFFDRAAFGQGGQRNYGLVKAVFVPSGSTADAAIADYVRQIGGAARNHTLVSSDRMVQAAARAHHVSIMTSSDFGEKLEEFQAQHQTRPVTETKLSEAEIQEWEDFFNQYGTNIPDGMSP